MCCIYCKRGGRKKQLFEQIAGCVMEAVWTNSSIMCNVHIVTGEAAAFQAWGANKPCTNTDASSTQICPILESTEVVQCAAKFLPPSLHYLLFHWKSKGQAIQSFQTVTVHCINFHSKHLWCWENSTMWIPGSLGPVPQFGFFAAPLAFSSFIAYTLHVVGRFLWNRQSTNDMLFRQDTKTMKTQVCQSFRNGIQQQNISARGGQSIFNRPESFSIPWCRDIYRWKLCCTSTHDINDIHWWLKSPFYTRSNHIKNQVPAPLEVDLRFRSLSFKGGPSWMTPCLEECFVREAFLGNSTSSDRYVTNKIPRDMGNVNIRTVVIVIM